MNSIHELLDRGVENIFPSRDFLKAKLERGEKVSLYLGVDPTGPTLHIGHIIPIKKLGQFQKLGHKVILLIGDFTAMIGDPTDKAAARKKITHEEVMGNLIHYKNQASRFISFSGENPAEFRFNSEWLAKMNFSDVLELASQMTVDQMLKRDMFAKRNEEGKPIYIHEFLYPLMQGYDSVAMDVDGEVGGNDQTFNMLTGRDLMRSLKGKEKFVIAMKLLVDPSGKKMGKSEGNMVALDQTPDEMFGKVMSWPDSMIIPVFDILTDLPQDEIEEMKIKLESVAENVAENNINPKDFKVRLAKEVVKMCYNKEAGEKAAINFEKIFTDGGIPEDIQIIHLEKLAQFGQGEKLSEVFVANQIVDSKSDFKRLVDGGAVMNMDTGEKIIDVGIMTTEGTFRVGKHRFVKVLIK